uniref:Uncharacterized protein n=1 Tax=Entomoneis paludosa TaxID=265537 RepID=A0A7S2VDF3_9STRA|mmetsp:Transcript_16981/g.35082  ORF Transcript_16981/g.35082 Transcript_16981/m.35082 type:complete len:121 (+) Transcript_16981:297-659(+)
MRFDEVGGFGAIKRAMRATSAVAEQLGRENVGGRRSLRARPDLLKLLLAALCAVGESAALVAEMSDLAWRCGAVGPKDTNGDTTQKKTTCCGGRPTKKTMGIGAENGLPKAFFVGQNCVA